MLSALARQGDIHAALARERTRHPGLRWTYARPLGRNRCSLTCSPAQRGRGLERCAARRRQIVVPGISCFPALPDRLVSQAEAFAAAYPELDVRCTDVLGDCEEIAGWSTSATTRRCQETSR